MSEVYGFQKKGSFAVMAVGTDHLIMTSVPSLLHEELVRDAGRAGARRMTSLRLVRPSFPRWTRWRSEDGGGRRGDAAAAPAGAGAVSR